MPIPSILTHRLCETLMRSSALADDRALRAVFVDERLAPWRNRVPEAAPDRATRVAALIDALCDQTNSQGENALVLLLRVLAEQTPSDDDLHNALISLAARLEAQPPTILAALKTTTQPPGNGVTITGDRAHVIHAGRDARNLTIAGRDIITKGHLSLPVIALVIIAVLLIAIIALANFPAARDQLPIWLQPRAFPGERKGEVLIVIATFHHTEGVADTAVHNEIKRAIEIETQSLDFTNLRVEVAPNCLQADDRNGAKALGNRYNASLVIWGADTGVRVSVNFYNHKHPNFDAANVRLEENLRTQIAAPSEYAEFITQDLPEQLIFLSLFAVGQSYYAAKDYPASAQAIEAAVACLGDTPTIEGASDAYFRLGWLYGDSLQGAAKALADYTRAIELDPENAWAYYNRGIIYHDIGEYDKALTDYTHAIELDPENVWAYTNRGNAYAELGEYDEAVTDYTRALEFDPEDVLVYTNRGITYNNMGEYDKALADYTRAIELNPDYTYAYGNRGNTYNTMGDHPNALADYNRVIELNPQDQIVYGNRGITYGDMGEYEKALADYTRALELDPEDTNAHYYGAIAYAHLGRIADACTWLENALTLIPAGHDQARNDAAFDPIRDEPCFQALMNGD